MMLIMLTPSLVCAMPVCTESEQAQETKLPCHNNGAQDHHGKKKSHTGETRLLKDCTGVDLQTADGPALKVPEIKKPATSVDIAALVPMLSTQAYAKINAIHGPPPDWPALAQTHPPILLTTQRIRI